MRLKIRENNVQKHFMSKNDVFVIDPPPPLNFRLFVGLTPTLRRVVCSVLKIYPEIKNFQVQLN